MPLSVEVVSSLLGEVYGLATSPAGWRERGDSVENNLLRAAAEGAVGDDATGLKALLARHVERATGLQRSLALLRMENEYVRCSVEAFGVAMVSLAGDGRVIRATEPARRLLDARDGLEVAEHESGGQRLAANGAGEQARLEELVGGAVARGAGRVEGRTVARARVGCRASLKRRAMPTGGVMLVRRRPPKRSLQVVVSPLRASKPGLEWAAEPEERACAMVFLNDPDAEPVSRISLLGPLYGLSPMEGRVADLLVGGLEVPGIGERLRIGQGTVRFYLKAIFRKTGTKRQSDVVRIAMRLPDAAVLGV